jgi:tRNA(Ile)-lysidine synthase
MLKLFGKLPQENIGLALSGGIDSMSIAHFLLQGRKKFTAFHFNHGTKHGTKAHKFVSDWCAKNDVTLIKDHIREKYDPMHYSGHQDFYRHMRYKFFNTYPNYNIILGHHLDDVLETWLFSTFHGQAKLIPYRRDHMIRPFLTTEKQNILDYAWHHAVPYIHDPSNDEEDYMRNYIRHQIVPRIEHVNPGIRKMIRRKILSTGAR